MYYIGTTEMPIGTNNWDVSRDRPRGTGILLLKLFWFEEKIVLENNFWNSRLKAENLQKFWDH